MNWRLDHERQCEKPGHILVLGEVYKDQNVQCVFKFVKITVKLHFAINPLGMLSAL